LSEVCTRSDRPSLELTRDTAEYRTVTEDSDERTLMARRKTRRGFCSSVDARSVELLDRLKTDTEWVAGVSAGLLTEYRLRETTRVSEG
jgi:hypothetical protein